MHGAVHVRPPCWMTKTEILLLMLLIQLEDGVYAVYFG